MGRFSEQGLAVHPTPTAVRKKRLGVTSFLPCKQCGQYNDANVTTFSKQGEGLLETVDSNGVNDSQVGSGCMFCGSLNWRDSKPSKFPDDRNLADPDRRIRR